MSVIGECRNNKECVIDKKNRTSCKACRLQKCLLVGMSKSGSRYGRRSNWFKQYFQETEQNLGKRSIISDGDCDRLTTMPGSCERSASIFAPLARKETTPIDLVPSPFSSHLYLNYFPRFSLNRFISCKRDSKFLLPSAAAAARLAESDEEAIANEYFGKILASRCDGRSVMSKTEVAEDPLDLSRKPAQDGKHESGSKKTAPLDLSIK